MKKETFDSIIKTNAALSEGPEAFGYVVKGREALYENYYGNEAFGAFVDEMETRYPEAFRAYGGGKGGELNEKARCGRAMPPKMASVASSSRFCYLALRDGAEALGADGEVEFECECRIAGISGTAPQLDARIPDGNIFVEAKCHEIFDRHKVVMKTAYWERVYGPENEFGLPVLEKPDAKEFEVPLSEFGLDKRSSMLDVKQLLCHLMGIASSSASDEPATLVYLFFKPKVADDGGQAEVDRVFSELEEEIRTVFASAPIESFCRSSNIALKAVAECARVMGPLNAENTVALHHAPSGS